MKRFALLVGIVIATLSVTAQNKYTISGYIKDSLFDVALGAFERVLQLEKEIEILGKDLENRLNTPSADTSGIPCPAKH